MSANFFFDNSFYVSLIASALILGLGYVSASVFAFLESTFGVKANARKLVAARREAARKTARVGVNAAAAR